MNFDEYQAAAETTAIFPDDYAIPYTALGLGNEAGEVQGVVKKYLRGDRKWEDTREKIKGELGDVLWYLSAVATAWNIDLDSIAEQNLDKLFSRMNRGVLKGDGGER